MSRDSLQRVAEELDRRGREALRVYRPGTKQEWLHRSQASQKVARGGNRSAKTLWGSVETAAFVLRRAILTDSGPIPYWGPNRPTLSWVIGYDQRHIGQTLYRELFEGGKYHVLRRLDASGEPALDDDGIPAYETWCPWRPDHQKRIAERKPVGPLIPPREIEDVTWENKGDYVFNQVTLKNGSLIRAYSSTAKAKQGDAIDYLWIDEDIAFPKHVAEWEARLSDKKGRMIWSAFPHSGNDALFRLSNRADEQKHREKPDVVEEVFKFADNPFIDPEEKRKRLEGWDDIERLARDEGEYLFELAQIYDWSEPRHGVFSKTTNGTDPLTDLYAESNDLPEDWTRYLAIDPGTGVTAVLSIAVPPPSVADELRIAFVVDRELYLARHTFDQVAKEVKRMMGARLYESFFIDMRAGRQTAINQEKSNVEQYREAFEKAGVRSRRTQSHFEQGEDKVVDRRKYTGNLFQENRIRVVLDRCPHFVKEIRQYRRRVVNHEIKDEAVGNNHHLMDCLEYLAMGRCIYVEPSERTKKPESHIAVTMRRLAELKGRSKDKSRNFAAAS